MSGNYTVRSGDTLSAIAAQHHVSLSLLVAANSQINNPDLIHPGDHVAIPGGSRASRKHGGNSSTKTTYRIASGDTLSQIAQRFHTSVSALARANNIANPNRIQAGAVLKIRGGSGGASSSKRGYRHLNAPVITSGSGSGNHSVRQNAQTVAQIARQHGANPVTAVSMMLVESGGNERAVGDGGTSFGLFQLHRGGMLTAAGLTPTQAFNPVTNARVAVASLARTERARGSSSGSTAAASQRPADPAGYARKVEAARPQARALIG